MNELPDFGEFVDSHQRPLLRAAWLLPAIGPPPRISSRPPRWNDEHPTARLPQRATGDDFGQVDEREAIRDALAVLSPKQRTVIVLRYFADLSEAQTATAMGCSVGAVKSHASRALARLRDQSTTASILQGGAAHER